MIDYPTRSIVGLYRNEETLEPVSYVEKLVSNLAHRTALILDPMLAPGSFINAAIHLLKEKGCKKIKAIVLVAAPEGVKKVFELHSKITIYAVALDSHLNTDYYIIQGLGNVEDKIFGTKILPS